jgi:hypothetical protein
METPVVHALFALPQIGKFALLIETGKDCYVLQLRFWGWQAETARPWPTNAAALRWMLAGSQRTTPLPQDQHLVRPSQLHARSMEGPNPKRIGRCQISFARTECDIAQSRAGATASRACSVLNSTGCTRTLNSGAVAFKNFGARVKGNVVSLSEPTRAYKVDLNKFAPGQKLGGPG